MISMAKQFFRLLMTIWMRKILRVKLFRQIGNRSEVRQYTCDQFEYYVKYLALKNTLTDSTVRSYLLLVQAGATKRSLNKALFFSIPVYLQICLIQNKVQIYNLRIGYVWVRFMGKSTREKESKSIECYCILKVSKYGRICNLSNFFNWNVILLVTQDRMQKS